MNHRPHLLALVALTLTLAGCGPKGPLYLPEAASEVVTRPAETPPASEPAPEAAPPDPQNDDPKKEKGATTPPPPK